MLSLPYALARLVLKEYKESRLPKAQLFEIHIRHSGTQSSPPLQAYHVPVIRGTISIHDTTASYLPLSSKSTCPKDAINLLRSSQALMVMGRHGNVLARHRILAKHLVDIER